MYNSKYYTCEQIDQRLLEGYYDDAVAAGYTGSKAQYLAGLLKAINYAANPTLTADKVVYNQAISGLTHKNVQGAIDELANKKFDKESILQESGDAEDKVMSQKAVSTKISDLSNKTKDISSDNLSKAALTFLDDKPLADGLYITFSATKVGLAE